MNFNIKMIGTAKRRDSLKKNKSNILKFFLLGLSFTIFLSIISLTLFIIFLIKDLPNISNIKEIIFAQSSIIYDRNQVELYTLHGDENRKMVALEKIPDSLIQATLAIEDSDFFEHQGFSVKGYLKAIFSEFIYFGAHKRGGSTITQQFVKNTFLSSEKTYIRKLKELILSLQLEWKYSKEEILEMYLNSIPYGSNAFGVEQASLTFFGKKVEHLQTEESTILAALPKAPSYYSPYGSHARTKTHLNANDLQEIQAQNYGDFIKNIGAENIDFGLLPKKITIKNEQNIILQGRTNLVLNRMKTLGYLSELETELLTEKLVNFKFKKNITNIRAPHFVLYVRDLLEEKYGKDIVNAGGLKIYTTLDYKLQKYAEKVVTEQVEKNTKFYQAKNAALVAVQPQTGEIIAMVGSKDYWDKENDGNVNVILQRRLPGSSFKPFAYAAAFNAGYSPATVVFDLETDFGNGYKPQNYDGNFRGPVSFRYALGNSLNIPAIKAGIVGGLNKTYNLAKGMGISFLKEADWYGSAISLGVAEIRPIDMIQAYAVFANLGKKVEITPFLKIIDRNGNILEILEPKEGERVLSEETAFLVTDVLSDPKSRGPGWNNMLQIPKQVNAVKTGTSNKKKQEKVWPLDGWTIGFTPSIVTLAWAGNNDGSTMSIKGSGYTTAAPIWRNFMIEYLKDSPRENFYKPEGIKTYLVSSLTGKLPGANFPKSLIKQEIFSSFNSPQDYDESLKFFTIEKISGDLPNQYTPEAAKKRVAIIRWSSLRPSDPNWEKPVQRWAKNYSAKYIKHLGVDEVIAKSPTKVSKIYNPENTKKPEINIISPENNGQISKNEIGIWVDINSEYGVSFVEYFLNDERVDTKKTPPYKGLINLPPKTKIGDLFVIKVKMYDTLYNSASATTTVTVAEDTKPPYVEIVFPKNKDSFPASSIISVQTYSYDTNSDIKQVLFFLDDIKITVVKESPYHTSLKIPEEPGEHTIKVVAYDQASNSNEDSITINTEKEILVQDFRVELTKKINFGESETINFYVPHEDTKDIKTIELIARYQVKDGVKSEDQILFTVKEPLGSNGSFQYLWIHPQKGTYYVFIKSSYFNGKVLFSAKNKVVVK